MVEPSAAVTVTVKVLSPATRSVAPLISNVAFESVVSTLTSTEVVYGSRLTTSPLITSFPFTWKVAREVSVLRATFKLMV